MTNASARATELNVGRKLIHERGRREAARPVDHKNPLARASKIHRGDLISDRSVAGSVIRTNKSHRPLSRGKGSGNQKSIHITASLQYAIAFDVQPRREKTFKRNSPLPYTCPAAHRALRKNFRSSRRPIFNRLRVRPTNTLRYKQTRSDINPAANPCGRLEGLCKQTEYGS